MTWLFIYSRHRETQTERLLMRQEKTMKLIVNALVDPRIVMTKSVGGDRAWVWSCFDYSEGTLEEEVFGVKFGSSDDAAKFKEAFDQSQKNMGQSQMFANLKEDGRSVGAAEPAAAEPLSDGIEYECPLSFVIIEDPVKLPHSPQVFERGPLVEWLARDNSCPMTRLPSEVSDIVEADDAYKSRLAAFRARAGDG